VLLLASDGLTGMLEDEHLSGILRGDGGPQQWVDRLINEANRRGGLDNITAIIIRIEPEAPAEVTNPSVPAGQKKQGEGR
jgi:protein phosphatase